MKKREVTMGSDMESDQPPTPPRATFDAPHLQEYLAAYEAEKGRRPELVEVLTQEQAGLGADLVYPLDEDSFVHIREGKRGLQYHVVEPSLSDAEEDQLLEVRQKVFEAAMYREPPEDLEALEKELAELFGPAADQVGVPADRRPIMQDRLVRDVARYGVLQPFTLDPYLEDIQSVGTDHIHVIHKYFDMLQTNLKFHTLEEVDMYVRNLSERLGRPVSDARPIVDATLADGSRINIVYSEDVSRKGPSFSIRRVHADPISVTQLISWGTMSPEIAAYVWLCLENAQSVFVNGEAACGKSATLNAFLPFIDLRSKLYSAEDTPELRPPHQVWQRLLTRETGPMDSRVQMFDLLKAALRSRPNYIAVGEIRGAEGAVAFQAMQTGHPCVATFHATDKVKMIQRLSAPPIEIPLTFMDNLNVAVFQQAMYHKGQLIRRIVAIDEIQGYSELDGGVITLPVFAYDRESDTHHFQGENNSFILEKKIAEQHGYEDPAYIYTVLRERAHVLQRMVEEGIFRFSEVNDTIFAYNEKGAEGLPFKV